MAFAWAGLEEPTWRVHRLPEFDDPTWTTISWRRLGPFPASSRDVMRDVVDNAHFEPVHGFMGAETEVWEEGPFLRTVSQGEVGVPRRFQTAVELGLTPRGRLRLEGRMHGPHLLSYRGTLHFGLRLEHILLSAVVPVDDDNLEIWIGVAMQRSWILPSRLVVFRLLSDLTADYEKDAPLWASRKDPGVAPTATRPRSAPEAQLFATFDEWWVSYCPKNSALG